MEALHTLLLMGQDATFKAAGIKPLLLAGANTQILICHIAYRLTITINTVAVLGPFQWHRPYGCNDFFHALNRWCQYPMVKDTFLWVGWDAAQCAESDTALVTW